MKIYSIGKGWLPLQYLYIVGMYLCCSAAFAHAPKPLILFQQQPAQIKGTITDSLSALPGVTITVKGKATVSFTDQNGRYSIPATPTDSLVYSFVGYKTITVAVNGRTVIDTVLEEDATSLQEVTVNAGYYSVKEKERTGSIARIKAVDIERQPVSNPLAAMQGRMAGVNITQSSGIPGGGFNIQIRGINSVRGEGNNPLYVVDGVPYSSQSLGSSSVSNQVFAGLSSPLSNINPADIESIEVLKDADATAIYGSRGANGVVLITTKRGKAGATKYTVHAYTTVGTVTRTIDLLNTEQYLSMRQEAFENDGINEYPENAYDVNGTWDQNRYTDWQKELLGGTAYINNVQLSASGGSANTQFLVGGTYRRETTVFPGDAHYTKAAVHSSITHRSDDDKFNLVFSADYSVDKNSLPGIDLTSRALSLAPNAPALYDEEGNLNWEEGTFQNPLGFLEGSYANNSNSLIANTSLSYKFHPGFTFRASLGYTDLILAETRLRPSTIFSPFEDYTSADSQVFKNNGSRQSWIVEPQLNWDKNWNKFGLSVLVGSTFQSQQQQSLAVSGVGFSSNSLINSMSAATTVSILNDEVSEYNYNAIYGRINLNYDGKYILNLTGRRDGSSRFGPGHRFANFGAIGGAWIFSGETFAQSEKNAFSFGKLRASFGITGNDQIGDYQFLDTYAITPNIYDGVTGLQPARLFNPDFGWETNRKLEAAIDLGFFNDRIFISAAYFRNRSSNQLVGVPLPGTTGFPFIQANLDASVQNTGVELELRTVNIKTKNFNWITTANLTLPKNELLEFPDLEGSTYANTFVIGE